MSKFQKSKFDLIFLNEPRPIIDSFKQVLEILHLFVHSRFFSNTTDFLNTNKIQAKCLSVDFRSIPLRFHPGLSFELDMVEHPLHLYNSINQFIGGNKPQNITIS